LLLHPLSYWDLIKYCYLIGYRKIIILTLLFLIFIIAPIFILSALGAETLAGVLSEWLGILCTAAMTVTVMLFVENRRATMFQTVRGLGSAIRPIWSASWRLGLIDSLLAIAVLILVLGISFTFGFEGEIGYFVVVVVGVLASAVLLLTHIASAIAITEDLEASEIIGRLRYAARRQWRKALVLSTVYVPVVGFVWWFCSAMLLKPGQSVTSLSREEFEEFILMVAFLSLPFTAPAGIVGSPLLYFDMRCRTEGLHLETLRE